jgi:hypothetical protein
MSSLLLSPTTQNTTGDRYRDLVVGTGGKPLAEGDGCAIRYRALRLGKRSRDGLSGEASTVFSFGYGEDDDKCVNTFFFRKQKQATPMDGSRVMSPTETSVQGRRCEGGHPRHVQPDPRPERWCVSHALAVVDHQSSQRNPI